MRPKIKPRHALITASIVVVLAAFTGSQSIAGSGQTSRSPSRPRGGAVRDAETNRIVRVLENRMDGQLSEEKAKNKLAALSAEKIRLLDSLAVRIIESNHTAAADIAFLLITTLLISS